MMQTLLAQYLNRSAIIDETAWPSLVEHVRFTGPGASNYDKAVRDALIKMLFDHGAKNGTLHLLPLDQMLEHPGGNGIDAGSNDDYFDPVAMLTLAADFDLNGVALHPGWARIHKAMGSTVPLILKVSGSTNVGARASGRPESDLLIGRAADMVEAAEYFGAAALGYSYYMGSPAQAFVHRDYQEVLLAARRAELPLVVWAYPRGPEIDKMGRDSFVSVLGAVTASIGIGADILKVNLPKKLTPEQEAHALDGYKDNLAGAVAWAKTADTTAMMRRIVQIAGQSGVGVIVSGGSKANGRDVVDKVQLVMQAGALGIVNGRNVSTAMDDVVGTEDANTLSQAELIRETRRVLADYPRKRPTAG